MTATLPDGVDRPPRSRAVRLLGHLAVLLAFALLLVLGTWQVERLQWKEAIVARIEARTGAEPVDIGETERLFRETGDVDYVPTRARGTFLHEGERHFISTFHGAAGWNVYAPLVLSDGSGTVFVNRGFVPYDRRDPATRPEGQVPGEVEIVGLARNAPTEKGNWFLPDNDPAANTFFWPDVADMAVGLELPADRPVLPFLLAAGPGAAPGGMPVGGTTVVDIPNNHLSYAITWYGLAAALLAMYVGLLLRGRLGRRAGGDPA